MQSLSYYNSFHAQNIYVQKANITTRLEQIKGEIANYNYRILNPIPYYKLIEIKDLLIKELKAIELRIQEMEQLTFPFFN